jgi:ElaB/YqjD/DUF883 family membrane-anchored ribosome-binding protein
MQTTDTLNGKDVLASVRALQEDLGRFKVDVTELLKALAHEGKERTVDLGRGVRDAAFDKIDHLRDMSACKIQKVEDHIAKNPLASVLLATGLGLLVGRFLRK